MLTAVALAALGCLALVMTRTRDDAAERASVAEANSGLAA
jgi:hypothetical protein